MLQLDSSSLYGVMQSFYTLTKIRIVIFDAEFTEVLAYPPTRETFCAMLRQDRDGEIGCQVSDKSGCLRCAKTRELVRYRCHAGLTEVVVPIADKNSVLAYVMFGQIIPKENEKTVKAHIKKKYPCFADQVDEIPSKSMEELDAAAVVLKAITSYVMTNRWVTVEKAEFIRQMDQYIDDHLSQPIVVEDICIAMNIGRTKLYQISLDYLGCGPAEYIRKRRIAHAQKLLLQPNLSIADIAYSVGFSDYNHFFRIFRDTVGTSPRTYRLNSLKQP